MFNVNIYSVGSVVKAEFKFDKVCDIIVATASVNVEGSVVSVIVIVAHVAAVVSFVIDVYLCANLVPGNARDYLDVYNSDEVIKAVSKIILRKL